MTDVRLDRIDIRILHELQQNGRLTNVELSEIVNLSPSPCLIRVKKLQHLGFISGYSAHINLAKLGPTVTIFTEITLSNHRHSDFSRFQQSIEKIEEAIECHLMSGGYDYLVKFVIATIGDYQELMEGLLQADIGVDKYFSFVVMKSPFVKHHVPLSNLFRE